jgi:hypothetical protein
MSQGMGVTTVTRVGRLPLWKWSTEKAGTVVAKGYAVSESQAWSRSISKAPKVKAPKST